MAPSEPRAANSRIHPPRPAKDLFNVASPTRRSEVPCQVLELDRAWVFAGRSGEGADVWGVVMRGVDRCTEERQV